MNHFSASHNALLIFLILGWVSSADFEENPWKVIAPEPVESTGWANFDNFENSLNMENTVIIDNKLCDESKREGNSTVADETDVETTLESKVTVTPIESDDTKIADSDDSSTTSHVEMNINHQSTEDNLYPDNADKNANPSEIIDSR